jgi:hypothetical protein
MLQEADSHGTADWIREISRHAALVNRKSSCGLSSCRDGHKRQRMGETQDWPITALFLDRWARRGRLGHEMLAITWLTTLREEEGEG